MPEQPIDFEQAVDELETIVAALEQGRMTLEESLAGFERGVGLVRVCRERLDNAETRVRELVDIDENGHARLRDFSHEATPASADAPVQNAAPAGEDDDQTRSAPKRRPSRRRKDPTSSGDSSLF